MTRNNNKQSILFVYIGVAFACCLLFSIFGPTLLIVQQHHEQSVDLVQPKRVEPIELDELDHEEDFRSTIKSCTDDNNEKKCGTHVPEPVGDAPRMQRVVLVAPPGDLAGTLQTHVEQVVHEHNKHTANTIKIDLITTTHVPVYGYGKTHGYTKIIRLVPSPLLLQATDALTASLNVGETYHSVTIQDLQAALLMILRLHCRLSHVSAHTALLSVSYMDLLGEPSKILEQLRHFLNPTTKNDSEQQQHNGDDDLEFQPDDDQIGMFEAEMAYGTQLLTQLQHADILQEMDALLVKEMQETKQFTKWPCPSFWQHNVPLSKLGQRLAQALSPDCDDPYAKCSVPRDRCEFHGDAVCKSK